VACRQLWFSDCRRPVEDWALAAKTSGGVGAVLGDMSTHELTTTNEARLGARGVALLGDPIANNGTALRLEP
jgi:hypothetical protein